MLKFKISFLIYHPFERCIIGGASTSLLITKDCRVTSAIFSFVVRCFGNGWRHTASSFVFACEPPTMLEALFLDYKAVLFNCSPTFDPHLKLLNLHSILKLYHTFAELLRFQAGFEFQSCSKCSKMSPFTDKQCPNLSKNSRRIIALLFWNILALLHCLMSSCRHGFVFNMASKKSLGV